MRSRTSERDFETQPGLAADARNEPGFPVDIFLHRRLAAAEERRRRVPEIFRRFERALGVETLLDRMTCRAPRPRAAGEHLHATRPMRLDFRMGEGCERPVWRGQDQIGLRLEPAEGPAQPRANGEARAGDMPAEKLHAGGEIDDL